MVAAETSPVLGRTRNSPTLPRQMRVLHITTDQRTGGWLAEAFAADSASDVRLEEARGRAAGLARLRDEVFDAVLVSHEPGLLDAIELIEGYRTGGSGEPIVVLGEQSEQEMSALCYEVGADGYLCVHTTTTRTLIWVVARASQRQHLLRENLRLARAEELRTRREREEAAQAVAQQQAMLAGVVEAFAEEDARWRPLPCGTSQSTARPACEPEIALPEELGVLYRDLLRTYVIMGSGNLQSELHELACSLASVGVSARQIVRLHLRVLGEMVRGLGSRSGRHVTTRADLLVMEVLVHLADAYRRRYNERVYPPVQRLLPGFE